jgi:hypothetical protein
MYKFSIAAIFSNAKLYNGETEQSSGSGFVISNNGDILTALHVAGDPELYESLDLQVYFPIQHERSWTFKGPYIGTIISVFPEYDLAIIRLHDPSFASSVPVLAFNFESSIEDDGEFFGYGYNTLTVPSRAMQPFQISAKYSSSANNLPYDIVQDSSFNPGASGGPLLISDNRVAAIWHGRFASFLNLNNQYKPVEGLSWVIPMNHTVLDWLKRSKIDPKTTPPEYTKPIIENNKLALEISGVELNNIKSNLETGKKSWISAPFGTEIVAISSSEKTNSIHCYSTLTGQNCITTVEQRNHPLNANIESNKIAYLNTINNDTHSIKVSLKESPPADDFELQSISFKSPLDSKEKYTKIILSAPNGKKIISGRIFFANGPQDLEYSFNNGTILISNEAFKNNQKETSAGLTGDFSKDFEKYRNMLTGTAIVITGNSEHAENTDAILNNAVQDLEINKTKPTMQELKK